MVHTVRKGDTMYALAREYNVPLDLLLRVNPNVDIYNLRPGSRICIPKWRPGDRPAPGRPMPGKPMPGGPMPGRPMAGRPMPGGPMPGGPMPERPMPGGSMPGGPMPGKPMQGRLMPGGPMPRGIIPEAEDMSVEEASVDVILDGAESNSESGYEEGIQGTSYNGESDMGMNMITDVGMPRGMYTDMDTEPMPEAGNNDRTFAYVVRDGDSVEGILAKFSITMEQLLECNKPENVLLKAGTTVIIPM